MTEDSAGDPAQARSRPHIPTTSRPPAAPDGRRARWSEHREARRLELIQAAVDAIARYGASAGMEQIAAAAGTSKPVIYRYFADKADLYRAVVQQAAQGIVEQIAAALDGVEGGRNLLVAGVRAYLTYIDEHRDLYRFVVNHTATDPAGGASTAATISEYTRLIGDVASLLLANRLAEIGIDAAYAQPWGLGMVGFVRNAADWWLDHPDDMTLDELADYITVLLWGGAAGIGSPHWRLPPRTAREPNPDPARPPA